MAVPCGLIIIGLVVPRLNTLVTRPPAHPCSLPEFFTAGLRLDPASGASTRAPKQPSGSENGHGHGNPSAQPQASRPPATKGAGILLAALERRGSGLIAAVRANSSKQPRE